jgi:hypothetical protein
MNLTAHNNNSYSIKTKLVLFLLFITTLLYPIFSLYKMVNQDVTIIQTHSYIIKDSSHAWKKHSTENEVLSAMDCLNKNGSSISYKVVENRENRNTWLCFDNNDWYSIVTKEKYKYESKYGSADVYELRTAFRVTKWNSVEEYQAHLVKDKSATLSNDVLPPNELNLQWNIP